MKSFALFAGGGTALHVMIDGSIVGMIEEIDLLAKWKSRDVKIKITGLDKNDKRYTKRFKLPIIAKKNGLLLREQILMLFTTKEDYKKVCPGKPYTIKRSKLAEWSCK